jgi:hypothetical protein
MPTVLQLENEFNVLALFRYECGRWPKDFMELYYYADRERMHLEISTFHKEIIETDPSEVFKLRLCSIVGDMKTEPFGQIEMRVLNKTKNSLTCEMTFKLDRFVDPNESERKIIGATSFFYKPEESNLREENSEFC